MKRKILIAGLLCLAMLAAGCGNGSTAAEGSLTESDVTTVKTDDGSYTVDKSAVLAEGKIDGDKKKIMDVMLSQDAVIFSVPTYDLMPASVYLTFAHRSLSYETSFLETIGAIEHKDRVAGLISVGGSTRSWQSMALEGLQATMFTTDMKVVDMMLATRVPAPGQCLLDDDLMARAHKLGEHIMEAVATPAGERHWLGEEDMGWCPNCHSNALVLGEMQWDGLHYPIECQVCGAGGTLEKTGDGKWKFVIQKDGLLKDRTTVAGRARHLEEIAHTQGGFFSDPEKIKLVQERKAAYAQKQFKGID